MPFALVFSIIAALASLFVLLVVARLPDLRPHRRFIVPAGAGLALIGVLLVPMELVRPIILSHWRPSLLLGLSPAVLAEPAVWPLALALSCAVTASALVQTGRLAEPRFSLGLSVLGMLAAGLAALWGENLLTVLIAWAGFDLAWGLGAVAAGLSVGRVLLGGALNGLSTLVLWAATLVSQGQGIGLSWRLMAPAGLSGDLLLVAGLLRLGLYPLNLALPAQEGRGLPGEAPLLLGPALGWGLLARLATATGGTIDGGPWLEGMAIATFIAGGLLAWSRAGPGGGWPWVSTAAMGGVLWAGLRAGDAAPTVLTAGGVAWILGVTLLHLHRGLERAAPWWSIASAVGGLALLGAPLTLGLVPSAFPAGSLPVPLTVGRAVAFVVGQALLTAAAARRVLRRAPDEEPVGPLSVAARVAGLALPVVLLLAGGTRRVLLASAAGIPGLLGLLGHWGAAGWSLWVVGTAMGAVLFWQGGRIRQQMEPVLGLVHDLLRPEWLLRLVLGSVARVVVFLGALADVMEGAGAILWALAVFLLIMLAVLGR